FTSVVLFQSAFFSVLENTTFGIVFMKSAMSPFCDGQYEAIPSYVTRPNNSAPVDFDRWMAYCSISSPQTVSCQSISQLFGPSKKPSSVTRFHMMSFLMSFTRLQRRQAPEPDKSPVGPVRRTRAQAECLPAAISDRLIRRRLPLRPDPGPVPPDPRSRGRSPLETGAHSRVRL